MSSGMIFFTIVLTLFVVVEIIQLVRVAVAYFKKRKQDKINEKGDNDIECNSDTDC